MSGAAAATLVARIAVLLLGGISTILTARLLGAEGRGVYALATNVVYFASLAVVGLAVANAYFAAQHPEMRGGLVGNSLGVALLGAAVAAVVLTIVRASWAPLADAAVWLSMLAAVPTAMAGTLLLFILLGANRLHRYNAMTVFQPFGLVLALLALWWIGLASTELAVFAFALVQVVSVIVALAWLRDVLPPGRAISPDLGLLRRCFSYAGWSHVVSALALVHVRLALFVVATISGNAEAGILSVALVLVDVLANLPHSLAVPLLAAAAQPSADVNQVALQSARASRLGFLAVLGLTPPSAIAVALLASPVFGAEFVGTVPVFLTLVPNMIAWAPRITTTAYLSGLGVPREIVPAASIGLVVNVVLLLMLAPAWGAIGAGIAMSLSSILVAVIMLAKHAEIAGISLASLVMPQRSDAYLAAELLRSSGKAIAVLVGRNEGRK